MRRFFELKGEVKIPHRWHLGEIRTGTGEVPRLRAGLLCEYDNLSAEISRPGQALEFSLTSFAVPVVCRSLAEAIGEASSREIQRIEVKIQDQSMFEILNVLRTVKCLDEMRSEFTKWTEQDYRSDLAGQYRQVTKLHIDYSAVPNDAYIFRVEGWLISLLVSEEIKYAMEGVGCLGAVFKPISID